MDSFQSDSFVADESPEQNTSQGNSITQEGADLLRNLGLGALSNTAADVFDAGKFIFGGGENAFGSSYKNPFRTEAQLADTREVIQGEYGRGFKKPAVAQDLAGLGSWAVPLGTIARGVKPVASVAGRGALAGGLQASSDPGANIESIARGAAYGATVNPVMGALGALLSDTAPALLGRLSLGPGGEALPQLSRKTGNKIGGFTQSGSQIADDMYGKTAYLRDSFDDLVYNAKRGVPRDTVFERFDEAAKKVVGVTNKREINSYLNRLKSTLQEAFDEFIVEEGYGSPIYRGLAAQSDLIPLPVLNKLRRKITNDRELFRSLQQGGKPSKGESRLAEDAYKIVRDLIVEKTDNPTEANRLLKLQEAAVKMTGNLRKGADNQVNSIVEAVGPEGMVAAALLALPGLNSLIGPLGVARAVRTPPIGTGLANTSMALGDLGKKKIAGTTVGEALRKLGVNLGP